MLEPFLEEAICRVLAVVRVDVLRDEEARFEAEARALDFATGLFRAEIAGEEDFFLAEVFL